MFTLFTLIQTASATATDVAFLSNKGSLFVQVFKALLLPLISHTITLFKLLVGREKATWDWQN